MSLEKKQLKKEHDQLIKNKNHELEIEINFLKESNIFDVLYETCKIDDYSIVFGLNELDEKYFDFKNRKIKALEQRLVK